jgi:hypothetical protein
MPTKKRQVKKVISSQSTKKKVSSAKTSNSSKTSKPISANKIYKSKGQYDSPVILAIAGLIGVILFYLVVTRALYTGSWWEYFFSVILITISIRLFIRSIRLK